MAKHTVSICIACNSPTHIGETCFDASRRRNEARERIMPHSEIHPAPSEFTKDEIATDPILHFFHYAHLPPKLQETSKSFFILARHIIHTVPRNAERTVALRKLLEGKDAAVRANIDLPGFAQPKRPLASVTDIGEPREIGGHSDDRDGPIKFG